MGICYDTQVPNLRHEEYEEFLKPGLSQEDVENLSKAFKQLDSEERGVIIYDVNKIADSCSIEDGKIKLNYDQFMEVMGNNILNNRRKYGKEIKFESNTNSAMCLICPFASK